MKDSEKFDRAIDRLRDEMAKNRQKYVQVVGEYLTEHLQGHPEAAGAILEKGKTIAGSLAAMRAEAKKGAEGGVGILDDETAFGIVLEYFGIHDSPAQPPDGEIKPPQTPAESDPFDLDALLAAPAAPGGTRAPTPAESAGRELGV